MIYKATQSGRFFSFKADASVAAAANFKIELVEGNRSNIKITTSEDMAIAEALVGYVRN